jgi:hypothetical protein
MKGNHQLVRYGRKGNLAILAALLVYAITRGAETGVDLHSGSVGGQVGDLLGFATLCALGSYATVELVKRLTPLRASVNFAVVEEWLQWLRDEYRRGKPEKRRIAVERQNLPADWFDVDLTPLLLRALGTRSTRGTFDLPPERLVAQIATAFDVALFQPELYGPLLPAVAGLPPAASALPSDEDTELLGSQEAQQLRLSLDNLQTTLTQVWRGIIQGAVVWIAGAYGVLASFAGGLSATNQARYLLAALILGGPIAWAIRDLTAVLGRLRN